jgi:CHAT domain-containing protein
MIGTEVTRWRETYGRAKDQHASGGELRRLLWEPLAPLLDGIETVLISPDGLLAQLPWGALPGEKSGTFLIEERAIAVIAVPQMLPELLRDGKHTGPPASLLLAGDIDYGGDPGAPQDLLVRRDAIGRQRNGRWMQFEKLPGAQGELVSIRDWYEQADSNGSPVRVLRRRQGTEAAFREQAPQHSWLHVITHGFFAPPELSARLSEAAPSEPDASDGKTRGAPIDPGLLSGLAFAGANLPPEAGKDDGILTALEVSALDLSRVDSVVLSACETGLGTVAGGEGLLGLQRSFQVAGAKTVVASLWKVPDAATSRLMQRFYENLWDKKMGKLEALREAQIWMMHDQGNRGLIVINDQPADANVLPPFYWAAFVLSGDWR